MEPWHAKRCFPNRPEVTALTMRHIDTMKDLGWIERHDYLDRLRRTSWLNIVFIRCWFADDELIDGLEHPVKVNPDVAIPLPDKQHNKRQTTIPEVFSAKRRR